MFKLKCFSYGAGRVKGIQGVNLNLNTLNTLNINNNSSFSSNSFKSLNSLNFTKFSKFNFSSKAKLDPYLILEVNRQADWKTIKQAYFRLARLYHPDMNKNDEVRDRDCII